MGLFDFFKKNDQPKYDATNIQITDLDFGYIFDYDSNSWEVQAVYEYDWGDGFSTKEFKISNGSTTQYLSVEDDDELDLSLSKKVNIHSIDPTIVDHIKRFESAPKTINYQNNTYYLEEESPGYFKELSPKNASNNDWQELITWDYSDGKGHCITIEQWSETSFDASIGHQIKPFEITSILPK